MTDAASVPGSLIAGDTFLFDFDQAWRDFPPPDWRLDFVLKPEAGGAATTAIATDTGATYRVRLSATQTAPLTAGAYVWAALAVHDAGDDRCHVAQGHVRIAADPATATGDTRSHAEKIVAAIDATLAGRASKDADSLSIEGRTITHTPVPDLLRLRGVYAAQVRVERTGSAIIRRRISL